MRKCLQSKIKIRIIKYRIFAVSCTISLDIEFIFSSSQWCSCWWCWWQRDLWQSRGWSYSWGWQTAATIESNHIILTLNTGHQHPTSSTNIFPDILERPAHETNDAVKIFHDCWWLSWLELDHNINISVCVQSVCFVSSNRVICCEEFDLYFLRSRGNTRLSCYQNWW